MSREALDRAWERFLPTAAPAEPAGAAGAGAGADAADAAGDGGGDDGDGDGGEMLCRVCYSGREVGRLF